MCVRRAVLESFRARHVRQEGVAVFDFWRDWAHWRALERRAIVAHWQKLMLLVRHASQCRPGKARYMCSGACFDMGSV
jgi:hypothetical protein